MLVRSVSGFALATPGEFMCNSVLFFCASDFCRDHNCKVFVINPILGLESEVLLFFKRKDVRDTMGFWNVYLHVRRQTVVFLVNTPRNRNVHWIVVFSWLIDDDKLDICILNVILSITLHRKFV